MIMVGIQYMELSQISEDLKSIPIKCTEPTALVWLIIRFSSEGTIHIVAPDFNPVEMEKIETKKRVP